VNSEDLAQLIVFQSVQAEAEHVGQDAEVRGRDFPGHPAGDARRGVQRDRRPDGLGGGRRETLVQKELARVVGAIDFEALLDVGKGSQEAGVVEHGRQVEQLRVGSHAEHVSVNQTEEEDPPGVVVDEGAGRLLDEPGRFGDRRRLRNPQPRDDL